MSDCAVVVTGASGMIGSRLVTELLDRGQRVVGIDRCDNHIEHPLYTHVMLDLTDRERLPLLFNEHKISHVIHLAALAHTAGEADLSYERYHHINVTCAENVFLAARDASAKVLYISTVDVYGFVKGISTVDTVPSPVTVYGKTKALAETRLKEIFYNVEGAYSIFRLSPVYTQDIKRDIQKRYYLKYPKWGYRIGKGSEYEVLSVENAIRAMADWTHESPKNDIRVIKDDERMNTVFCLEKERSEGRADHVIWIPRWMAVCGYSIIRGLTGKNKYTYLLNKAVYPLRTE